MNMQRMSPDFAEQVSFSLRALYHSRGYSHYKMSKFEEYDLYARNKDFLVSDSVITFTDASGRLLALKPDVTLSIIKNSQDRPTGVQKVYYTENVYRASKTTHAFKEIMQVGLECFGDIDDYHLTEVLTLAARSLQAISPDWVLDISHLGLLAAVLDGAGLPPAQRGEALRLIGEKNTHELAALCRAEGVTQENIDLLTGLVTAAGDPATVLPLLRDKLTGVVDAAPVEQLSRMVEAMDDPAFRSHLRLDFSVVDNMKYYTGIVFKGFVEGIPTGVLSGGQYDKLMERLGRRCGAVGFAVYLDELEPLDAPCPAYDVDVVLLYEEDTPLSAIRRRVEALSADGTRVLAAKEAPTALRYQRLERVEKEEVAT